MAIRYGRQRPQAGPHRVVCQEAPDDGPQSRMRELAAEELEEAVELVRIAPKRWSECRRVRLLIRLERAHLELKPVAEALDPAGTRTASPSSNRPSRSSTSFQTRASIRPLGSTSSSARYGEPERVRRRSFRATA